MREISPARWLVILSPVALALLVGAVFSPIWRFEFVDFDVHEQVVENPYIRGLTAENVKHILTSRCITSYYPVRSLSFALDYQIWGLEAGKFKLTNSLIHLANAILVFWLLMRLFRHWADRSGAPRDWRQGAVAAFSAAVFAAHPVVVEPVAWIPGREELLMLLGALGCLHFHITARSLQQRGGSGWARVACHGGAALCCAMACLSSAVAAVIPAMIVAWDALTLTRPKLWKIVSGTAVLWLIGGATILVKRFCERGAAPILPGAFTAERTMLALNMYGLNLKSLLWPRSLCLYYDWEYPASFLEWNVVLGGVAVVLTCLAVWVFRRRGMILFGLAWFALTLAPAAQIMPHHIQRADRFLYLPLVGLVVALAAILMPSGSLRKSRTILTGAVTAGLLTLLLLGLRSAAQVQTWQTSLSAWQNCLKVAPANARAHDAFADNLVRVGRVDLAIAHFELAIRQRPFAVEALTGLAYSLATAGTEPRQFQRAIELVDRACEINGSETNELRDARSTAYTSLGIYWHDRRDFGQAIHYYYRSLEVRPTYDVALVNLAYLLATCPDERLRRPEEAVRLAELACSSTEAPSLDALLVLATVHIRAGRFGMAAIALERAIEAAEASGASAEVIARLQSDMRRYDGMLDEVGEDGGDAADRARLPR